MDSRDIPLIFKKKLYRFGSHLKWVNMIADNQERGNRDEDLEQNLREH